MFDGQNEYNSQSWVYLFHRLLNADWTARVKKSIKFPCGEMWGMKRNGKKLKCMMEIGVWTCTQTTINSKNAHAMLIRTKWWMRPSNAANLKRLNVLKWHFQNVLELYCAVRAVKGRAFLLLHWEESLQIISQHNQLKWLTF